MKNEMRIKLIRYLQADIDENIVNEYLKTHGEINQNIFPTSLEIIDNNFTEEEIKVFALLNISYESSEILFRF